MKKKSEIAKSKISHEQMIDTMIVSAVCDIQISNLDQTIRNNDLVFNMALKQATIDYQRKLEKTILHVYSDQVSFDQFMEVKRLVTIEMQGALTNIKDQILATLKIED